MIRVPSVLMMRQPPVNVPSEIALAEATTTQSGTWKLDRSRTLARFALDWFDTAPSARSDRLDAALGNALDAEIADIARFLGLAEYQRA